MLTGSSSEKKWVEAVPKLKVAGSNPVSRSTILKEQRTVGDDAPLAALECESTSSTRVHTFLCERGALAHVTPRSLKGEERRSYARNKHSDQRPRSSAASKGHARRASASTSRSATAP